MWLFSIVFSITADGLRKRQILSTTATRKIFTTIGTKFFFRTIISYSIFLFSCYLLSALLTPACGLVGASYTGCDRTATVTLVTFLKKYISLFLKRFAIRSTF